MLVFVSSSRLFAHFWLGGSYQNQLLLASRPRVLIYGANRTGDELALALANSREMKVVGFLDDNSNLHKRSLNGFPVFSPVDLDALIERMSISHILLAMPDTSRKRRNDILNQLRNKHVSVRTLPSLSDIAHGRVDVSDLKELDIDDLLGRDPVKPNSTLLRNNVAGKVVMVTGAGGSIGSELCRQIMSIGPRRLILVEQSEYALYTILQELEARSPGSEGTLVPLLTSVLNANRLERIMRCWLPDTVYHAAAYKHVPLVEHNPAEGLKNNVFGTLNAAQSAAKCGVRDFVLISTDKAVRPTNVMGASKRLAEMTLQAIAATCPETRFSMVRFGNVLGSSGSVVPKFRQQIRSGGPLTLTHPDIIRYFMTIPEAAQLVIQAGAMASGGDVFVLDMGEPVKIIDLARKMIELSGLTLKDADNPEGDIEIETTGLRPGEKLYEELLIGDNPEKTTHPRIMKARELFIPWDELSPKLDHLRTLIESNDIPGLLTFMLETVSGYTNESGAVDWLFAEARVGTTDTARDTA